MKSFVYERATDVPEALALAGEATRFLGGGTNLVDLMRENIEQPERLVDVTRIPGGIEERAGELVIGGEVRNTRLAEDRRVRERFPVLSEAILQGASGQIRNMATTAGNLMQRTRCYYFYDSASRCNKRCPGSGCDAREGFNRIHAILGASRECVATHPSDMCVALAALDAVVYVQGQDGERRIAFTDFHRLPGSTPHVETDLRPGELITRIHLPGQARNSLYRKVRDRSSYAFALVSVAGVLELEGDIIRSVRLALGGVAHKPWRAVTAEQALQGQPATSDAFLNAARAELAPAEPLQHNAFKLELARRTLVSVLAELARRSQA